MYELDTWNPKIYSECSGLQYNAALKFLDGFHFNRKEDILDIGCGDGKITEYLALNTRGLVIGIDKSPAMITFANKTHVRDNLSFEIMDVEALKIEKKFDVITSFFCLPWVQNKAIAFNNMASLLKENGKLITIFALFADPHINLLDKLIKEPRWERYFRYYPSPFDSLNDINYEYYASSAGIQLDSLISKSIKHVFKTKSELENFFTALVPHVNQISERYERKAFVDDIVTNYLKESVNTDYSLTIDSISLVGKLPLTKTETNQGDLMPGFSNRPSLFTQSETLASNAENREMPQQPLFKQR